MIRFRNILAPALGLALLLVQGCSAWQVNRIADQLPVMGPQNALQELDKIEPPERDLAQYLLNRGTLKFYLGDLASSREDLAAAARIMESLQASSVTENLAAVSTNETLRSYTGTPTDQVMVHVLLALTYLCDGDLDGARVEILQSQVAMQRLAKADSTSGQLAVARFVAGVIYELNREWDDALISYRQAHGILTERNEPIPLALQDSLLLLTRRQGIKDEYKQFKKAFGRDADGAADQPEVFLIYLDGVVSTKTEARLSVVAGEHAQLISVVVPSYPPVRHISRPLQVQAGAQRQTTGVIENLDTRARDDLADEMATIMATTTARAVAKYNLVNEAQNKSELGGLLANIATIATEQADVRSWNMLPANVQIARLAVAEGATVQLPERAEPVPAGVQLALSRGRDGVLVVSALSPVVLGYPPDPVASPVSTADATDAANAAATNTESTQQPVTTP